MTVAELIKALRKQPKHWEVYMLAHDGYSADVIERVEPAVRDREDLLICSIGEPPLNDADYQLPDGTWVSPANDCIVLVQP